MNSSICSPFEIGLVGNAKSALQTRRRSGKNTVCGGVLTAGGQIFLGLDLVSRKFSVCAEPAAISLAHFHGHYDIITVVAVCFTPSLEDIVIIPPCGACRELIWYHHPKARVLIEGENSPVAVPIADLFAIGDLFSK